ncbi:MAG: ATP-binding protein [Clostridia bacterium]|nr:ATP-binding protein [Clostridia bacterium]
MNYPKKVTQAVADDYARKRLNRDLLRTQRLKEVYALCPEIEKIDKELSKVISEITSAMLGNKEAIKEKIAQIRTNNLALQERRRELLLSHGFGADYTEPPYECNECSDTGYKNGKLCSCYRNALISKAYAETGFGRLLERQSFESFSIDAIDDEEAKERASDIYSILLNYANNFSLSKDPILLVGGTGVGKTHLSSAVARVVIEKGYNVVYDSAEGIFRNMGRERLADPYSSEEQESYKYYDCDLLIIDDLGSEMITSFSVSCLYNIINTRINKGLPIIISTNNTGEDIKKKYDERIASRIFGEFHILLFKGTDQRRKKLSKK